ncbi:MAG: mechanosensitive ion channel family protein [Lentisphaeria bacterium]|nr:mechanosensitive ion channel family protein [Lentisphaeria bacterium]
MKTCLSQSISAVLVMVFMLAGGTAFAQAAVETAPSVPELTAAAEAPQGALNDVVGTLNGELDKGKEWLSKLQAWAVENGANFLVNLLVVIIILIVGKVVIGMITKTLHKTLHASPRVEGILEEFITSIVSKVLWVIVLMMALKRFGVDIGPMIAGLGVMGFVVGFAFQESLGNLAAGVMLALNRPFKVGDFVDVGGCLGKVVAMDMMATTLTSPDNKKLIVPNKSAWGNPITNYTALDTRRVDLGVGISYGSDITKAKQVIMDLITQSDLCLDDPAPVVELMAMADSSLNLVVRPWVKTEDYWDVYFGLNQRIKEALDAAGIEIPFPQQDVHIKGLENMSVGK